MKAITIGILGLLAGCVESESSETPPTQITGTALSRTLYINAEGGPIAAGAEDATQDSSTILVNTATLRPYLAQDPQRLTKIAAIEELVETTLAPYAVTITTTRPAQGPYAMVMLTDDGGSKIGLVDTVMAIAPVTCNEGPSVTSFVFTKGGLAGELIARSMIEHLGLSAGIPHVVPSADCMHGGDNAGPVPDGMCTISGANTAVAGNNCGNPATTIDVHARFLDAFGAQ